MSAGTAVLSYLLYSILTGVTFSFLLLLFTPASLALTFFVCAGMFGTMAIYGLVTKSDLSGMGTYLLMGLVGLIIAGLINMFLHSSSMDFVISIIDVIVFTLLTAYDVQMVKQMGMAMIANDAEMTKVSIVCALRLYLDFVNLFLYLLRFFGQKKD
jgi:FtsH-binding integral membrane protein